MTQKLLLAAIALGLWANAAVHLTQPALAQRSLEASVASIASELHTLVTGDSRYCQNSKIC